jgi:hypothetical protein
MDLAYDRRSRTFFTEGNGGNEGRIGVGTQGTA